MKNIWAAIWRRLAYQRCKVCAKRASLWMGACSHCQDRVGMEQLGPHKFRLWEKARPSNTWISEWTS